MEYQLGLFRRVETRQVRDELQERIASTNFLSRVTVSTFHINRSLMSIELRDLFRLFSDLIVAISGCLFDEGGGYP
jgi:hypothetical protein